MVKQAQNGVNFDFEVKFDLEGQGQSTPKTIGILTKVFYTYMTYGPNLVILAWTCYELSHGQTWWRTDRQTQATTIPEGQNWPRVKMYRTFNPYMPYCERLNNMAKIFWKTFSNEFPGIIFFNSQ